MLICTVNPSLQLHLLEHAEAQELEALKRSITDHGLEWLYTGQPGQFIEDSLRRFANRQGFWAGLRLRNELVGVLGINNVNDWTRSAEVDYALGPGFRGKGLMTQAVRAMLDYGFGELHLNRIEIRAGDNSPCLKAGASRLQASVRSLTKGGATLVLHHGHIILWQIDLFGAAMTASMRWRLPVIG